MIITVASGKGGTGKTTFAVNLAYALTDCGERIRLLDCDVEEPNDHLFVKPDFRTEDEVTVAKPVWDETRCTGCGQCAEACNYNAIAVVKGKVLLFSELCHSCGACSFVCPEAALEEQPVSIGKVHYTDEGAPFFFAHGLLNIGDTLAPKVVQAVKTHIQPDAINIIDASPGTACPVVKALEGTDVAVLVTEPTPFGLHDLKLATAMTLKMRLPTGIVVNRSDGDDRIIAEWAATVGVPIVGRIPFERKYAEAYAAGHVLIEWHHELKQNLLGIYEQLCALKDSAVPAPPDEETLDPESMDSTDKPNANIDTADTRHAVDSREITIISGKGGTGKTTVTASFAALAQHQVLADNDVDAADLHLLLTPQVVESHPFAGGARAIIDPDKCIGCGKCSEACHFDAMLFDGPANDIVGKTWRIDPLACEGCGLCARVCPVDAIHNEEVVTGTWYISRTDYGPMVHARLGIAEENSGRLVTQVRQRASELASEQNAERILGDGPPGTGCPVIASISGADLVLIVTEPTVSGAHDLKRVLELSTHFGLPALVILNKADLNAEQAERIDAMAREHNSRVIACIPFDRAVNDALMNGQTVVGYGESEAASAINQAWEAVQSAIADMT